MIVTRGRLAALVAWVVVGAAGRPASAATAPTNAEPQRFALVVGANDGGRPDLPRLRFADDDAIRNAEVLRALGADVTLLVAPDADTRTLFPAESASAEAPTRARLLAKVEALFRAAAAAKARGREVDFYFVFAGHGGFTEAGEGALFLPDGALTRHDLYESILARSPADFNHLVIDACHAYFFVSSRGADDVERRLDARAREYLDAQTLERFPNTGVAVASSAADTTVEWSEYQGGVFSHEVRSALLGAGDVNGDRQVTYAELGAFISAANSRVVHVRAKLNVFVRAPARAPARPLTNWTRRPLASLSLDRQVAGHLWVEDQRGVRLSEVNKAGDQSLRLALLDRERYFLRLDDDEYSFQAAPGQEITLAALTATPPHASERGSMIRSAAQRAVRDAVRAGLLRPLRRRACERPAERVGEGARAGPRVAVAPASARLRAAGRRGRGDGGRHHAEDRIERRVRAVQGCDDAGRPPECRDAHAPARLGDLDLGAGGGRQRRGRRRRLRPRHLEDARPARRVRSAMSYGEQTRLFPGLTSRVRAKNDPVKVSEVSVPRSTVAFGAMSVPLNVASYPW